jgi:glycosyltransferase involved in cell wall biosynthesis
MRNQLLSAGFSPIQVQTVYNAVPISGKPANAAKGEFVGFAGRLSREKGLDVLLEVAERLPGIPFRVAGTGPMELELRQRAPSNVHFEGFLSGENLTGFYRKARMLVVPSIAFETFAMTAAEAMAVGLPVVASKIGSLPELVVNNVTGYTATPGNAGHFSELISKLWRDPSECRAKGLGGREWVKAHFSRPVYISKLLDTYLETFEIFARRRVKADPN